MSERIIVNRYEVLSELGTGGMGTVFLAHDTKLKRHVAVKALNEDTASDSINIERFKREVKAVAALSHANVISLYDFIEDDGHFYAVMEYAAGQTLDHSLAIGELSRDEVIRIATGIASGLSAAHQQGIVHRDIKPANILITDTGQVKILDFGLAKDRQPVELNDDTVSAIDLKTQDGTILGTVGYMAPEQVVGKPSDARSDVFSFGVVLYEMLTGKRAFKRDSAIETLSAILREDVSFPSITASETHDGLVNIARRCLEKEPELRFKDLTGVVQLLSDPDVASYVPKDKSNNLVSWLGGLAVVAVLVLLVIIGPSWINTQSSPAQSERADSTIAGGEIESDAELESQKVTQARQLLLPEMIELTKQGKFLEAYELGQQIAKYLPEDTLFLNAFEETSIRYTIRSVPAGAAVYVGEYGEAPDQFVKTGATPIENAVMSPGLKHIILRLDGYQEKHLLYGYRSLRNTATSDVILYPVDSSSDDMVRIPEGGAGRLTGMTSGGNEITVPEFLMDRFEVTNADYQEFVDSKEYDNPVFWSNRFIEDGKELTFDEAQEKFVDTTGRKGPSTWEAGTYKTGMENLPVQGVSWYEARAYARFRGKELPTIYHWLRARTVPDLALLSEHVSYSNINGQQYLEVGSTRGMSLFGIFDLYGNVAEWMVNSLGSQKLSLGGAVEDQEYFYNQATSADLFDRHPKRGFRCIKNLGVPIEDLANDVELELRDYSDVAPISNELFAAYRSQFDYDSTPLSPRTELLNEDEFEDYTLEIVSFASAYDSDDRILAYLYLPKHIEPPYQTIIWFQGAWCIRPVASRGRIKLNNQEFFLKSGRAFVIPVLKGQYERNDGLQSWKSNDTTEYANFLVKWTKDFRRTVDYLETRTDVAADKLGYYGTSWGAFNFPIIGAVEPRIKTSICIVGGLSMTPARPEVDQISFIHRVKQPTLWLAGEHDPVFPFVESSRAAFRHLGTVETNKRFVSFPTGHHIPRPNLVGESLDWLDKHLGPVEE